MPFTPGAAWSPPKEPDNLPAAPVSARTADVRLLFATRIARLFAYGLLSVVLVLYLAELGLDEGHIGLLLTLTLLGDTAVSLWITTRADRLGRRRMLLAGAGLMVFAGILFAVTRDFFFLLFAATVGVISPSGNEIGPFLPVEQAALSQLLPAGRRTGAFAWYNLVGSFATALGALASGLLVQGLLDRGTPVLTVYRLVIAGYGLLGLFLVFLFSRLTPRIEIHTAPPPVSPESTAGADQPALLGLRRSRGIVFGLARLFALDSFAGGFIIQSLVAYWFVLRFGVEAGLLGAIFFGANLLAGISALSAAWIARRIGLVQTMVFTHLPSNLLLMFVPLMPTLPLAVGVLLLRFSISQMDVPTRQAYLMAVVDPQERSAAAGVTGVARAVGASLAPLFTGLFLAQPALLNLPFFIAGGLKVIYDLLLYRRFRSINPES
jgi:MFS family permease